MDESFSPEKLSRMRALEGAMSKLMIRAMREGGLVPDELLAVLTGVVAATLEAFWPDDPEARRTAGRMMMRAALESAEPPDPDPDPDPDPEPQIITLGKPAACPYCEKIMDGVLQQTFSSGRSGPGALRAGDLTLCSNCAQVLVFDPDLMPRKPVPGEVEAIFAQRPAFKAQIEEVVRMVQRTDRRG